MSFAKYLLFLVSLLFGASEPPTQIRCRRRSTSGRTARSFRPHVERVFQYLEERIPMSVDLAPYCLRTPPRTGRRHDCSSNRHRRLRQHGDQRVLRRHLRQ